MLVGVALAGEVVFLVGVSCFLRSTLPLAVVFRCCLVFGLVCRCLCFCSAGLDVVFEAALYTFSDAMTPLQSKSLARVVLGFLLGCWLLGDYCSSAA